MTVYFSWENAGGYLIPFCRSSVENDDGISPLACVLMDDGGLDIPDVLSSLEEGLEKIELAKRAESTGVEWERETWSVKLTPTDATVYSLHDAEYVENISISAFEKILISWFEFISAGQAEGASKKVDF